MKAKKIIFYIALLVLTALMISSCTVTDTKAKTEDDTKSTAQPTFEEEIIDINITKAEAEAASYIIDGEDTDRENAIVKDFIQKAVNGQNGSFRTLYYRDDVLSEVTDVIAHDDGFSFKVYDIVDGKIEEKRSIEYTCIKEVTVYDAKGYSGEYTTCYAITKDKDTTYAVEIDFWEIAYSSKSEDYIKQDEYMQKRPIIILQKEKHFIEDKDSELIEQSKNNEGPLTVYKDKAFMEVI